MGKLSHLTRDLQRVALSQNDDEVETVEGRVSVREGPGRQAAGRMSTTGPQPWRDKKNRQVQNQTKCVTQKPSTSQKSFKGRQSGSNHSSDAKARRARHFEVLLQGNVCFSIHLLTSYGVAK